MAGNIEIARQSKSVLRDTRRRVSRIEIETHRIKADLARLEADREDSIADRLTDRLAGEQVGDPFDRVVRGARDRAITVEPQRSTATISRPADNDPPRRLPVPEATPLPHFMIPAKGRRPVQVGGRRRRSLIAWLQRSPAISASLLLHIAILLLCGSVTFVTWNRDPLPLLATAPEPAELWDEESPEVQIEPAELESLVVDQLVMEPEMEPILAEDLVEFDSLEVSGSMADAQEFGFSGLVTSDMGTLLAGPGGKGDGPGKGRRGRRAAKFFGTEAEGNRIVFVVDNSGSMKQGRMETTLLEILRSVELLEPDQFFYVIFYSDRAYPMFYPEPTDRMLPATPKNKRRLEQWLGTVELCTGGKLVDAIGLAARLNPHVVYLLSDGAIGGRRTMEQLTAPSEWEFTIHTLGMTVRTPEDAAKLVAIAEAHGGTFQYVRPNPLAIQMNRQRPIKQNKMGVAWGAGNGDF
jgi:hypothetical protein